MSNPHQPPVAEFAAVRRSALIFLAVGAALCAVVTPQPAAAQPMEPIVIVGYFGRTSADMPTISSEITLSTNGRNRREFGLMRVQSQLGTAGADVFTRTLNPVILVRGQKEMIERIDAAGPAQKVKIIGMFDLGSNGIIVTGVDITEPSSGQDTGEKPASED
jgi:hypothetical protein